jgi:hypothetical protein
VCNTFVFIHHDRGLLASADAFGVAECFGDFGAGCCGAQQCERLDNSDGRQFNAVKTVIALEGETYTVFNFSIDSLTNLHGGVSKQFSLLLTLDAMAELSVVHAGVGASLEGIHIGCSPLDGFVAWRQSLPCASCDKSGLPQGGSHDFSFRVKVLLLFLSLAARLVICAKPLRRIGSDRILLEVSN